MPDKIRMSGDYIHPEITELLCKVHKMNLAGRVASGSLLFEKNSIFYHRREPKTQLHYCCHIAAELCQNYLFQWLPTAEHRITHGLWCNSVLHSWNVIEIDDSRFILDPWPPYQPLPTALDIAGTAERIVSACYAEDTDIVETDSVRNPVWRNRKDIAEHAIMLLDEWEFDGENMNFDKFKEIQTRLVLENP